MSRTFLKYFLAVIFTAITVYTAINKIKMRKKKSSKIGGFEGIKVEVINASGSTNADREMVLFLRKKGIDVLRVVRTKTKIKRTYIVERYDINLENAIKISKILNCPNIEREIDRDRIVKVTIVMGEDYKKYIKREEK